MPSLRRALSTPSVRASPYPSLTSRPQRSHPHGHRRSSGSDLTARKVLADIDWWRVADGQSEKTSEEEEEGGEGEEESGEGAEESTGVSVDADPASAVLPVTQLAAVDHSENASIAIERPSTPDVGVRIFGLEYNSSQHRATPRTPTRRTVSESSASSLESTPEVPLPRTPLERLSFADMGFADPGPDIPFFHMRLASLSAVQFVPKFAPEIDVLDKDPILADSLICHEDLFA
ncbi:hypothetical protein EI94DRAFT_1695620 [Lactarius quietus]|nr:hypothetical protein EI94DRAFT_1695620 [Lactarius quietus]